MSHLHDKVSALVDGELTGQARARALAHVHRCRDCRSELEATLALKQRLGGLRATVPSPDLFSSLAGVCVPAGSSAPPGSTAPWSRRLVLAAACGCLAVLTVAYLVGAPDEPVSATVRPQIGEFSAEFAGDTGLQALSDPAVSALAPTVEAAGHLVQQVSAVSDRPGLAALVISPVVSPGDDLAAIALLRRAMTAPSQVAYDGTRLVDNEGPGGGMRRVVVDMHHSPLQGTSFEIVARAGTSTGTFSTFVARRAAAEAGGLTSERLSLLVASYDIDMMGADRMLGRPATVVGVSRHGTLSAKFWIDDATGLVLRRELYDDGAMVRSSRFTALDVLRRGFLAHLAPELELPSATTLSMQTAPSLNDQGWTCPDTLESRFSLTRLRQLDSDTDAVHATYSDGLTTISIFEERGTLDASSLEGFTSTPVGDAQVLMRFGLPTVAVWESAGTVYTVVTDAPNAMASSVVAGLPHETVDDPGVAARVGSGLDHLLHAVNPLS